MEILINLEKSRKSVGRVDGDVTDKKKDKLDITIEQLGLQNFEKDLVTKTVVRKSVENSVAEESQPRLMIDLQKAGTKHIPRGAERFAYNPTEELGIIYIPVNRLERVYQSEKATNPKKVAELVQKMRDGKSMDPVEIGYNYDVHDGHHRWDASIKAGYTHVPCKVRGDNPKKLAEAKRKYRQIWKSTDMDLVKGIEGRLRELILLNMTDEDEAIQAYAEILGLIEDSRIREIILEIMTDELDHYHNLSQVLRFMEGDTTALNENRLEKSEYGDLAMVIDLTKGGGLDTSKLVQMRVPVQGKGGKTFYRMQWINPKKDIPEGATSVKDNNNSTFGHSKEGLTEMEKRQSNKFPITHYPTKDLKNTEFNYMTNNKAYNDALAIYHEGGELPYIKITPTGEILDNHHLADLARDLGLSHVPTIVVGNPRLKKQLEDQLKEKVVFEDEHGNQEDISGTKSGKEDNTETLPEEVIKEVERFKNITKKKYSKQYLMDEAREQGIKWSDSTKAGNKLPAESNILWMRAHQAIIDHISSGEAFTLKEDKKAMREHMNDQGKDGVEEHFLKLMEKFDYSKDEMLEQARKTGIFWKEKKDPDMNWMYGSMAIKNHLRAGKMFSGVRTRQKELIQEQELVVSDQMKQRVTDLREEHGKMAVMERANTLGIVWNDLGKNGEPLPAESRARWMRAHQAISKYIAQGNDFNMTDNYEDGLTSSVNDNPHGLSTGQLFAMDVGRRNSKGIEPKAKQWALKAFQVDRGVSEKEAEELYTKFMENARKAKVVLQFNPFEKLPNGTSLIDQLISDGEFKNDYSYDRGYDYERKGYNENSMFTDDYWDTPDEERPVYGVIDLFNRGTDVSAFGDVSIVLGDKSRTRSTGSHVDADSMSYGQDGKTLRSMEDPHHLVVDRWMNKWKTPNKKDGQRIRAMDAVLNGSRNDDDSQHFEAHIHGPVNLREDVDYIAVPKSWQTDEKYKKHLAKVQELSNFVGTSLKFE